jgi:hypothetical protein
MISIKPQKVKPKILRFPQFFDLIFVQNSQNQQRENAPPYEKAEACHMDKNLDFSGLPEYYSDEKKRNTEGKPWLPETGRRNMTAGFPGFGNL